MFIPDPVFVADPPIAPTNLIPTVWLDTNVYLDFHTTISVFKNRANGPVAVEETRRLMRTAAWVGIALDEQRVVTTSLLCEVWDNNMKTKALPGTSQGAWSASVAHVVKDYVCPNWVGLMEQTAGRTIIGDDGVERPTTNDERDQVMVDLAKAHGMTVITRDRAARKRAKAAGVPCQRPEDYAGSVIAQTDARDRFMARLDVGILHYVVGRPRAEEASAVKGCIALREIYTTIWAP